MIRGGLQFGAKQDTPQELSMYPFKHEKADYSVYWDVRKGLIPIVGGARESGMLGCSCALCQHFGLHHRRLLFCNLWMCTALEYLRISGQFDMELCLQTVLKAIMQFLIWVTSISALGNDLPYGALGLSDYNKSAAKCGFSDLCAAGTSMLIEDVACPVEKLGDMTLDLIDMFERYGYKDASCFGHALEGNLHLVFSQVCHLP